MSGWKLTNFCESTLAQAVLAAATTIYIDPDDAANLPTLSGGNKAKAVIFNSSSREIVNVTAWAVSGELTVERAKESTTAADWAAGVRFVHTPTAEILQAVLDATVQAVYRGTATGTNTITVTTTGSTPTPSDGDEISFEVANTNTAAVTLQYTNGTTTVGPFAVVRQDGTALKAGELVAGYRAQVVYDSGAAGWTLISQTSKRYNITHVNTGPIDAGNLMPNGGLDAWNNGTSFNTPASGTETAENVIVEYDGTIGAFTATQQAFTLGQTDVPGGPKFFHRWDQSSAGSASSYRRIRMRIHRIEKYALETVLQSVYMKADIARNVTAKIIQSFGTGGAPSAEVTLASEVWALGTSWAQFDLAATLTSIAGKTLGSAGDDGLILELGLPVNTSMTIDYAMAQTDYGDAPTKAHARFPWMPDKGGTGGVYDTQAQLAAGLSLAGGTWLTQALFNSGNPDLAAVEALAGTDGILAKTAANTWALRNLATGAAGLTVANPAGIAGNPTYSLSTALVEYHTDPMSVAELASVTAAFGTAAFKNLGTSGDTVVQPNAANVFSATQTIQSTDAGAGVGPDLVLDRFSASPAASDAIGAVYFRGRDSGANATDYATIAATITDPTNGSEDGQVTFSAPVAGAATTHITYGNGKVLLPDGTVALPGWAFANDTDTGVHRYSGNFWALVAGGTAVIDLFSSYVASNVRHIFTSGSVGSVAVGIGAVSTSGLYSLGSHNPAASANSTLCFDWNTTRLQMGANLDIVLASTAIYTSTHSVGFRGAPATSGEKSGNYTLVLADGGGSVPFTASATLTIPLNSSVAFPIGTTVFVPNLNGSGALTVAPDGGVTLRRGDATAGTGNRTVAADSGITLWKRGTNEWYIFGQFS